MTRQTDLPIDNVRPVTDVPGFSYGFSESRPSDAPPKPTPGIPPRLVELLRPQYRFTSSRLFTSPSVISALGANAKRRYLMLQNTGGITIYLGFGANPTLTGDQAIELPAGIAITFENEAVPNNDIFAVSSAQSSLAILEGSISDGSV
jgi:hypothetical protein